MASSLLSQRDPLVLHDEAGLALGMESIRFQGRQLFNRLTEAVGKLRTFDPETRKRFSTKQVLDSNISNIIKEEIGFNCSFYIKPIMSKNAAMYQTLYDRNHPFFSEYERNIKLLSTAGSTAIALLGEKARGSIDLSNARVTGIFSEIPLHTFVTYGLLADKRITSEEIAAIILHELGHAFTQIYYLGHVVTANLLITHASRRMLKVDDSGERTKILKEASQHLGIEVPKIDSLLETPPTDLDAKVETVMINAHRNRYRSITGTDLYDLRNSEQLADHFAVMHGAGSKVATFMNKMYLDYGIKETQSNGIFLIKEILKAFIALPFLPITFLFIISANPVIDIYDKPIDRIRYLRKNMNDILKTPDLPKDEKEYILKEIDVIKTIESKLTERNGWYDSLTNIFNMNVKFYNKQVNTEKLLEDLIFNDLYAKSAELSLLKGQSK